MNRQWCDFCGNWGDHETAGCPNVSESPQTPGYMFEVGKEDCTSDGFVVTFVRPIEVDGMYNVFRHMKELDYKPYYTDEFGKTEQGERVLNG